MTSSDSQTLLEPSLLHRLEQLSVSSKARVRGNMQGKRISKRHGTSLEFADYRLYVPGDDIRRLDWNAFGRTGKPFLKLFLDEQELLVHLYIDASASMAYSADGAVPDKFQYARQLAACIGLCALGGGDRVSASGFSQGITHRVPILRGKGSSHRLLRELSVMSPQPQGSLFETFLRLETLPKLPGMTWLFSDLWYEAGITETLDALLASRQEIVLIQVLDRTELEPALEGDLRLIDMETNVGKEVAMSHGVRQAYRKTAADFLHRMKQLCFDRGIAYRLAVTDVPVLDAVAGFLRDGLLHA